jgi:hypothetical protein
MSHGSARERGAGRGRAGARARARRVSQERATPLGVFVSGLGSKGAVRGAGVRERGRGQQCSGLGPPRGRGGAARAARAPAARGIELDAAVHSGAARCGGRAAPAARTGRARPACGRSWGPAPRRRPRAPGDWAPQKHGGGAGGRARWAAAVPAGAPAAWPAAAAACLEEGAPRLGRGRAAKRRGPRAAGSVARCGAKQALGCCGRGWGGGPPKSWEGRERQTECVGGRGKV